MRVRRFTDYGLRVLLYAAERPGRRCPIPEIARAHGISEHHLVKVAHTLGKLGWLDTLRGRGGGVTLAVPPETIRLGAVVRRLEGEETVVDCVGCLLKGRCGLACALHAATQAFYAALDQVTLADVAAGRPAGLAGVA